jgi:DNA-binding PadR family transcriptional regulator
MKQKLDILGPLYGYGIARRIEQISGDLLAVNQGTLYPVLLKQTEAIIARFFEVKAEDLS